MGTDDIHEFFSDKLLEKEMSVEERMTDANGITINVGDRVRCKDSKHRWGVVQEVREPKEWFSPGTLIASMPYLPKMNLLCKHVEVYDPAEDSVEREITDHRLGGGMCNDSIRIFTEGDLGVGGAHVQYRAELEVLAGVLDKEGNVESKPATLQGKFFFQNGDPHEVGVNGLTNEVLLAIVLDRLQEWQNTKNQCRENAIAITHLQEAQNWLARRSRLRECQGVEGQPNVPHVSP